MRMVGQNFLIALDMLLRHKLRAFLTMLGVIIGVMSVTLIIIILNGFNAYITGQFKDLGSNTLFLFYDPGRRQEGQTVGSIDGLHLKDVQFILDRVPTVDLATPMLNVPQETLIVGNAKIDDAKIYATDQNFRTLNSFNLDSGRSLSLADVQQMASVCVIGEDIRDRFFPGQNPLGKTILAGGLAFKVIGVVAKQSFMGDTTARMFMVPISTARKKWVGGDKIDAILLQARPGVSIDTAMNDTWRALMTLSNNRPIFRLDSSESILKVFTNILGIASTVLAGIAALSLLVGGIGIMNIMIVSVTERTKEIGLRKAVGAPRNAILIQFLIEAGTLSLIGGLIGMALAFGFGQFVQIITLLKQWPNKDGLQTPFPISAAIMSAAFSGAIGMLFGFYPAWSASKLDPIVALRSE